MPSQPSWETEGRRSFCIRYLKPGDATYSLAGRNIFSSLLVFKAAPSIIGLVRKLIGRNTQYNHTPGVWN